MNLDVDYLLEGTINNQSLQCKGKGTADTKTGRYELEINVPSIPFGWDPALVILICCDRSLGVTAREIGGAKNILTISGGDHEINWRGSYLYDPDGRHLGHVTASSTGSKKGNKLFTRSQILDGYVNFNIGETIKKIRTPYYGVMQPEMNNITLLTTMFCFATDQRDKYWGYTNYPYKSRKGNVDSFQKLTVEKVEFARKKKGYGEIFNFSMVSKVTTMKDG